MAKWEQFLKYFFINLERSVVVSKCGISIWKLLNPQICSKRAQTGDFLATQTQRKLSDRWGIMRGCVNSSVHFGGRLKEPLHNIYPNG